ncbi:MAG: NADH-quinone oxidoreductase subunit A [Actinobacteria bacterium]|nr:MAG: NADH-quinone oxidoreductase subunit A [Actinomycetota bacterium]
MSRVIAASSHRSVGGTGPRCPNTPLITSPARAAGSSGRGVGGPVDAASFGAVALAGVVGVLFVALVYGAVRFLAPSHPTASKLQTYECGVPPRGQPWLPFRVQYYVFALLFVIFDIETAFFFPWVLVHKRLAWVGLAEVTAFVAVLWVGVSYAWRKGALRWE